MVIMTPESASSAVARRIEIVYDVPNADERWVLEEETMPESALHDEIILLLVELLKAWARRSARDVRVGRNPLEGPCPARRTRLPPATLKE